MAAVAIDMLQCRAQGAVPVPLGARLYENNARHFFTPVLRSKEVHAKMELPCGREAAGATIWLDRF